MTLGVVGAGNMGGAIIKGYANSTSDKIYFHEHFEERAKAVAAETGAVSTESLAELVRFADIIIVALKPNMFDDFLPELAKVLSALDAEEASRKIVVSIAAGISLAYMENALGQDVKTVRVMPNTPAMVGCGMTALALGAAADEEDIEAVKEIFDCLGRTARVSESLMDTVVGISGSSPAYAYMYIQALAECAEKNGMDAGSARVFAAQSAMGAAKMVLENSDVSVEQLRINVCSPGGTTIEAVNSLMAAGFMDTVAEAMEAAIEKSKTMTR